MLMPPLARKAALTVHVVTSVGFLGAVAAFLTLALVGLGSTDAPIVRSCYLAMDLTARLVIVPLGFASLVTGLVQSLGTKWGLLRHWWVLIKLAISLLSTIVLLIHLRPIAHLAALVAEGAPFGGAEHGLQFQLVVNAAAAMVALLIATTLSIFKPRGVTRYGWRRLNEERAAARG